MSFSDYLEAKVLDHVFGKLAYAMPTAYVALSKADPLDDGTGMAEPVGGAYARKATVAADWASAIVGAGSITNANAIVFANATGAWGTVTFFAIFDALTGGNILTSGALGTGKIITSGDPVQFDAGALNSTLD